jgi:hypothetical protein
VATALLVGSSGSRLGSCPNGAGFLVVFWSWYAGEVTKVVLWLGPVSSAQVRAATLPDADRFIVIGGGCPPGQGDPSCQGSSYFAQLADKYFDGQRYLPKLLKSKGIDPQDVELYIGSFSAGHGAVKKFCMSPDDRALIAGIALADSTYCAWPNKVPQFAEGYVRYCVDAVTRPKLFVATSSASVDPAGNTPAGDQCMLAIKAEVEKRTGMQFSEATHWPASITPAPVKIYQLGNCILADLGSRLTHPQHATLLAPQVWSDLVAPWAQQPIECFNVARIEPPPASTQGLGQAPAPIVCSMWGHVPAGIVPSSTVAKMPVVQVDHGDLGAGGKVVLFLAGGLAAYGVLTWAKSRLDAAP